MIYVNGKAVTPEHFADGSLRLKCEKPTNNQPVFIKWLYENDAELFTLIGGRVINTSNRSERYVGYSTKYGDLSGDVALFWDYCVEEVYKIGHEIAKDFPKMPVRLITKTPDDGLSGMTDEEKLGFTYEELDDYLLRNIYPEAKVLHNITIKHHLAEHKMNIHLRHPLKVVKGAWEF